MPVERDSHRIVIAGASSLLGVELKSLLEESRFVASDFRLLDEELAAGTLTAAAGEPAVIRPVEADSFERTRFVFFTGSAEFTRANLALAQKTGARIIDLSGHALSLPGASPWFPGIESLRNLVAPVDPERRKASLSAPGKPAQIATIPSAAAESLIRLTLSLQNIGLRQITATILQPVSAWGKLGIEELETQTTQLLALQTPGKQLFDAQIAFSTLDRFGASSRFDLHKTLANIRNEVRSGLGGQGIVPAIQLVQVPAFYGTTFSVCAELNTSADAARIQSTCKAAGFSIAQAPDSPNNLSVAEESAIQLAQAEPDAAKPGTWWFWGAVDNIRLPAWNAVKLAEKLGE
jgi:aspartate-semialdehyde dehydrogenase